ncbi:GvpL/GvpF family gas vesicle protein [Streptomyces griseus]|uniref:GvpL/GvpF family gas vesicle protein n=1 Tax=Streptomyces TaxID=1883 RepID=UPI0029C5766B|nr:GvpL/GvpF family gas vesicle protein [Streptomyces sp. ID01-9D]MDX5573606.1 GvpL/GvpF family gas vesicle protein [Streptomyces sp. ID01-9D]WTC87913.1 GvpL/GvpF family gas vesicle protein [Streptomyces griseus]WTD69463.1 GvpL/GvpF family gas vesicle protein [Streptomyces griseus]
MTHRARREQAPDTGVTYVFAVCRGTRAIRTADVTGLVGMPGGAAVRLLPSGPLTAVVQTVPAADFTDEVWQSRLSDPREIERYARAHHEVVSAAAAHGPAVPLPLATLYHDDERARRALDDEAHRFHRVLKRIAHHAEWGVKVYEPATAPEEAEPVTVGGAGLEAPAGAGLAYLNRRRGAQERREQRRERALFVAESVDAELCELAAASRRLRTHGAVPGGDGRAHVLNATYLVAERRAHELGVLVRELGERTGSLIELTGPWVPYSFVGEA